MSKDIFDIHIGRQLRNAHVPVPSGSWAAIQAQIAPAPTGNLNFGFGLAAVVGTALLIGLGTYSSVREPENIEIASTYSASVNVQPEVLVESNTPVLNEVQASQISFSETTNVIDQKGGALMPSLNESAPISESVIVPGDQSAKNAQPASIKFNLPDGNNSVKSVAKPVEKSPESPKIKAMTVPSESIPVKPTAKIRTSARNGYAPLEVNFENTGKADSHLWDFGALGKTEGNEVTKSFDKPGIYQVGLTASNTSGDSESNFVTIEVKEGSSLFMPTAVYPAGINKTYRVEGVNLKSFHLTVVNSTGKVIFESRNINEAWDVDLSAYGNQSEIYIAVVSAEGIDGVLYNQSKTLTIIQ